MSKSRDAFRTISEVADWLDTPAHVLRFWESKFTQVKPVKRAGGRRYYRPTDMELLGGIKKLLHDDGMTIKGVQKVLRDRGVKHVSALSQQIEEGDSEAAIPPPEDASSTDMIEDPIETNIVSLHSDPSQPAPATETPQAELFADPQRHEGSNDTDHADTDEPASAADPDSADGAKAPDVSVRAPDPVSGMDPDEGGPNALHETTDDAQDRNEGSSGHSDDGTMEPFDGSVALFESDALDPSSIETVADGADASTEAQDNDTADPSLADDPAKTVSEQPSSLPSFLRPGGIDAASDDSNTEESAKIAREDVDSDAAEAPQTQDAPAPSDLAPPDIDSSDLGVDLGPEVERGPLSNLAALRKGSASELRAILGVVHKLKSLRDRMNQTQG